MIDNFDEIERLERLIPGGPGGGQPVLLRVTPDVRGETHEKISTGQADSKFGFAMADAPAAIARVRAVRRPAAAGPARAHRLAAARPGALSPGGRRARPPGGFPVWDLGGGLGVRYVEDQPAPPSAEEYVAALVGAAHAHGMGGAGRRLLIEPGRALCANACVTLYTVESVKQNVSRWVAVDGGMSDNLRPMLYDAPYEAHVADRFDGCDPVRARGQALRVRRCDRARGDAGRPPAGRCDRDAGDRRLRLCDGQQLQRRARGRR